MVSDVRAARSVAKELSLPVTGTIGILKALWIDGVMTAEGADAMLQRMVEHWFYSPVRRISDLLS